jgi:hypothetical protein
MLNALAMARKGSTGRDPVVALELDGGILLVRGRAGRNESPATVDHVVSTEPVRTIGSERN